jgi:NAD(P)-dependent dehydrogenase (short-subunit alcohol dehydrogenase family)
MASNELDGKVIAVTGAAGALGREVTKLLASRGATVVAIDTAAECPASGQAMTLCGIDLTDYEATRSGFAEIVARFEALHGLANVAGGFRWQKVEDGSLEGWEHLYRLNVGTCLNACNAAIPALRQGGGAIVNVAAAATARATAGMGSYTASKSGVARLTEALAEENKDNGVRVNAVLPAVIDTPANRLDMPDAEFDRWVKPEALAEVIAFLLSDRSAAVTGAQLAVTYRL